MAKRATDAEAMPALKDLMPFGMELLPDGSNALLNLERGVLDGGGRVVAAKGRVLHLILERAIAALGRSANLITALLVPRVATETKVLRLRAGSSTSLRRNLLALWWLLVLKGN